MIRTKGQECVDCKSQLDGAASVEGEHTPGPGDVTVCLYCGAFYRFKRDMSLHAMTADEFDQLPDECRWNMLAARTFARRQRQ